MKQPLVCVDCSPLLVRSAGVKTYLFHLVNALLALSPAEVTTFLAPEGLSRIGLDHDGGPRMYPRRIASLMALNALPRFASDLAAPASDVFHCSNLLRKLPLKPRLTATLHDLTSWIVPECHTKSNVAAEHAYAERVLRPAVGIMADSENSRQDAIRILGLSPDKIQVVHLGVPDRYFSVAPGDTARVTNRYHLQRPYFLSVGTVEPRKNIDTLLSAWEQMPPNVLAEIDLVVVGMPGWNSKSTMSRLIQAGTEQKSIRYLGYVPEDDLPGLTAGALAFVYPSLYEGFGIPVVQAMASGTVVITSNVSSLPEVAGDAALLIDPRSVTELRDAMARIAESPGLREQLRNTGREQAARFSWNATARSALQFFRNVAGS